MKTATKLTNRKVQDTLFHQVRSIHDKAEAAAQVTEERLNMVREELGAAEQHLRTCKEQCDKQEPDDFLENRYFSVTLPDTLDTLTVMQQSCFQHFAYHVNNFSSERKFLREQFEEAERNRDQSSLRFTALTIISSGMIPDFSASKNILQEKDQTVRGNTSEEQKLAVSEKKFIGRARL